VYQYCFCIKIVGCVPSSDLTGLRIPRSKGLFQLGGHSGFDVQFFNCFCPEGPC